MDFKNKYVSAAIIVVLILVSMGLFNRWINQEVNETQTKSSAQKTDSLGASTEESQHFGKPLVDPMNDPLAPMVALPSLGEEGTSSKKKTQAPSEEIRIYEFPKSTSPILVQ